MPTSAQISITESLSRFEPFGGLAAAQLEELARGVRIHRAARNEMIMHRGDRPAGMYLIVEGEVKLYLVSSTGAEKILRIAAAGDSFCEESVLNDRPQTLAAQASGNSILLHIPQRALRAAMSADAILAQALMARLSERMCELLEGMERCVQGSSTQRVARYLVEHAHRAAEHVEVRLSSDKQTIASLLNLTPETFSRVLNRLTRDGCILPRGRRAIALTDLPSLQSMAA